MTLAERHWATVPDELTILDLDETPAWVEVLCTGAGFAVEAVDGRRVKARRLRT
jgi:hypothetical protein